MRLENERKKLEKLLQLDSKLPSLEELELKIENASRELEKKDEKLEVSPYLFLHIESLNWELCHDILGHYFCEVQIHHQTEETLNIIV